MKPRRPELIENVALRLPPRFLPDIDYYRVAARYRYVVVDVDRPFNKRQKEVHRAVIADTHGALTLTVPIAKGSSRSRWSDIRVSTHDGWWTPMWNTIESAYGRTPFFEFYADRFLPFFQPRAEGECEKITELDECLHGLICQLLHLEHRQPPRDMPVTDYSGIDPLPPLPPYYQVRMNQLGYIPGLSIIDMLFNLGPEAELKVFE